MNRINKVAQITVVFWIMKILATTLGETFGDLMSMTLNWGYLFTLGITMLFFVIALIIQLAVKKFYSVLYWITIVGTTTVGTEISDFMDRSLGLGYFLGSVILFSGLLLTLFIWFRSNKILSVYPIVKIKTELFYWITILFSNSLGTAFGDFLSDNMGFSYLQGALITSGIIAIVIGLHYLTRLNRIVLF